MKVPGKQWDFGKPPGKHEIERMYRMAYCINPKFLTREDVVNLGIDLGRLKEFGEVRMKKGLSVIRKQVKFLWDRMEPDQKAAYILGDVVSGLKYVKDALQALEDHVGPLHPISEELDMIHDSLFSSLPLAFRQKVELGFGKWKTSSDRK